MIGNDIVDFALARKESNWTRKGFLEKIFTPKEKILIMSSENPELKVWNLWTRKEAAYKIFNRQTNIREYFPYELECFDLVINNNIEFGLVQKNNFVYHTKTTITGDLISTIAVKNSTDFEKIKVLKNRDNIAKSNGLPYYEDKKVVSKKPVSISHHGRFEQIITI